MPDLGAVYEALRAIGEDPETVLSDRNAYLVAQGHRLVGQQSIPGVHIEAQGGEGGIQARIRVERGARIEPPVHLCFALFERFGVQDVGIELVMEPGAQATFWSHCLFTVPEVARHAMDATMALGEDAVLRYEEVHYHGLSGGIEVFPKARVRLARGARFRSDFTLTRGRVGKLEIDYQIEAAAASVTELTSRVYGHVTDSIRIREAVALDGEGARGLIKSRVAVEEEATAEVIGITEGNAAGARGHVDCLEIVRGAGRVSASPVVRVTHPQAKVTHEAAIGSVDQHQLETLMARGLDPDDAVDVIVRGMLR